MSDHGRPWVVNNAWKRRWPTVHGSGARSDEAPTVAAPAPRAPVAPASLRGRDGIAAHIATSAGSERRREAIKRRTNAWAWAESARAGGGGGGAWRGGRVRTMFSQMRRRANAASAVNSGSRRRTKRTSTVGTRAGQQSRPSCARTSQCSISDLRLRCEAGEASVKRKVRRARGQIGRWS